MPRSSSFYYKFARLYAAHNGMTVSEARKTPHFKSLWLQWNIEKKGKSSRYDFLINTGVISEDSADEDRYTEEYLATLR